MDLSYLYNKAKTICFVLFMMNQMMVDLDGIVASCVTKIECAKECLIRNCNGIGFNKTRNKYYLHFDEHHVAGNDTVFWYICDSKMLDDIAEADVTLRTVSFKKSICKSSALESQYPFDCMDVAGPVTSDKVYTIFPSSSDPYDVQCMTIENKTWTIVQRREDGSQDFYLNWTDYKHGFGNKQSEYWIGNEALYLWTSKASYQLLIQLEDFENEARYALYDSFSVASESSLYRLHVSGYSGDAGDSLFYQNGQAFSTTDNENDKFPSDSCPGLYHGGWWYNACHFANLNGQYLSGVHFSNGEGIMWKTWRGFFYSYKVCRMLIRRK